MRPVLLAALLGTALLSLAQEPGSVRLVPPAPAPAPAAEARPLDAAELRSSFARMGFDIGSQSPLPRMRGDYEMTSEEVDAFLVGLRAAMVGQAPAPADPGVEARFDGFLRDRRAAKAARAKAANAEFLAKVDADKAVTRAESGLRYQVIRPGDGAAKPKATSTVTCRYHGTLADGTVFDSTRNRGDEPVSFSLAEVIPGWTEGLQLVGKGGVIRLWIPANLAYGDQEAGPIPGGSVLAFEIELLDVK